MTDKKFYNFLDNRLKPSVTCDVPYSDDDAPENLLLPIPRPFMAYNVVKAPATLRFKFICKININCIKIYTKVGSLKSTHIEIGLGEAGTERICYGICEKAGEDGVCFVRDLESTEEFMTGTENLCKSRFFRTLRACQELVVTIKRTMRCPPVLKRIEIWGSLSRDCTVKEFQFVEGLLNPKEVTLEEPQSPNSIQITEELSPDTEIPEEFLDQITFELMSLPMTLPSGKIIDEKTLEKCQHLDLTSNRPPSDPFTGQPFNSHRKPVFNSGLKVRIDQFLISNSDKNEFQHIPRTVGTFIRQNESHVNLISVGGSRNSLSKLKLTKEMSFESQLEAALKVIKQKNDAFNRRKLKNECYECKIELNLYKIKNCDHFICRNCLLGSKDLRLMCGICKKLYKKSDVEKFHGISLK